jgi:PAS domain S-box-containing protein
MTMEVQSEATAEKQELHALRVENAKLHEELQSCRSRPGAEQAHALSEAIDVIARVMDTESGPKSIYAVALQGLQHALGIERASILFFDPDGVMRFKAWLGISESYRRAVEGHSPWKQGTLDPAPIVVSDVEQDATLTSYLPIFAKEDIRALAFIPLLYCRNLLGKFMLYSREPYQFTQEMEFALALGKLIAFGICRNNVEEELRESKELFRAMFDFSSVGKILLSPHDGRLLRVNTRFSQMIGYSPEELMSMTYSDVIHPAGLQTSVDAFRNMMKDLRAYYADERYIHKDGRTIWTSVSASPIRNELDKTESIVMSVQDITVRRETETKLRESEARKAAILEAALDCIVTIDHKGRIIEYNRAAEIEFGYLRADVLGKEMADVLIPVDLRERHRKGLADYLLTGKGPIIGQRIETVGLHANGTLMPIELSVTRVATEGPPIFTGFIRNISERQKTREDLRRANEDLEVRVQERTSDLTKMNTFLTSLIENIPNIIFVKDARDLRFVRFNRAAEDTFGLTRQELIGKNDYDFFPESEANFFTSIDRQVLANGSIVDVPEEPIHTRLKGERILHTIKIPLYDLDGRPEYLLGISEDITDKKRAVEDRIKLVQEREARIEAEKAIQLRDDFLSIAAHELRTPLTPIRMYLQLVKQHIEALAPELPKVEPLRKAIGRTDQEFERFLRLVENLLDVSRMSAGRLILDRRQFDLAELVKNVVDRFGTELRNAQCDLNLDIQCSVIGYWDSTRIEQVVVNLLTNAMKYGSKKPIDVTVSKAGANAFIRIKDLGIGISKEDQEKIFQRFERVAPLKHFGGFGLGLFISREIVAAHGGTIHVTSEPGVGSTFFVELPCC